MTEACGEWEADSEVYMQDKGLVCYKVRVNLGGELESAVQLIVEEAGLTLHKDEVTATMRRQVSVTGVGEGLTGALYMCRIYFPEQQAIGLLKINDGSDSFVSYQMWMGDVTIEVGLERLGGSQGKELCALMGLGESVAARKTAVYPCKGARVTEALRECLGWR